MINSHEWIDAISKQLFAAENRRIDKMVEGLNRKNSAIKKKALFGFMHLGQRYVPESCKAQAAALRKQPMPTLAFELLEEANGFLVDVRKVELDKEQIKQVLFKLLYPAQTLQEIRDALPDCLVPLAPNNISKLNRHTDDPTWFIRNDERALKQYRKMLPKIEMYAVSRMIY